MKLKFVKTTLAISLASALLWGCSQSDSSSDDSNTISHSDYLTSRQDCSIYQPALTLKTGKTGGEFTFSNWTENGAPIIFDCFTRLTGIEIANSYFTDNDMLMTKITTGGASGYDVIVPELNYVQKEIKANALQKLDKSKLPNYKYINKSVYKKMAELDPGNQYVIAYSYGTIGIGYNVKLVKKYLGDDVKINDWDILLNPKYLKKLSKCGVSLIDSPEYVYAATLAYLGKDAHSKNPEDYKLATEYLVHNVRPYLTYIDTNLYLNDLASGNLCLAMGYSGDILRANHIGQNANPDLEVRYVLPKSGAPIWFDTLAIPKDAPNLENAYIFLNYMLDPRVNATNSNFLFQPNGVDGSKPYMKKELASPDISPTDEMIEKLYIVPLPTGKLQEEIAKDWFSVKYGVKMS
ncbi:extracellular solute-binding protein [Thiotrichales bacterium 19S11-10]|nr:extracellular solute-binding protein [Thiotrichales bacterium 19S11-10]MCF6808398.1 extracellular solute-binding protein [Thiotrichales bacterium 19S9-11]MCF6812368.1 extracellular solute-binding protein [Thiotrichales bacterium 19S9-12]